MDCTIEECKHIYLINIKASELRCLVFFGSSSSLNNFLLEAGAIKVWMIGRIGGQLNHAVAGLRVKGARVAINVGDLPLVHHRVWNDHGVSGHWRLARHHRLIQRSLAHLMCCKLVLKFIEANN